MRTKKSTSIINLFDNINLAYKGRDSHCLEMKKEQENTTSNATLLTSLCEVISNAEINVQVSALSMVLVFSLVGNILVIYVVLRNKHLRRGNNLFFMNMAISDLLVPLMMLPREIVDSYKEGIIWPFSGAWGDFTCKMFMFLQNISAKVSILTLICMAIDRFCAIVFPTKITLVSEKTRSVMIVSTWIIASATSCTFLVTMRVKKNKHSKNECFLQWPNGSAENSSDIEMMFDFIFFFILPQSLLIILYSIILRKLKVKTLLHSSQMARKRMQLARRVTIMTLVIVGLFGFLCGPNMVFFFLLAFRWDWKLPPSCSWQSILFTIRFLAFSHAAVNPFVCFVFATKYRQSLKDTFKTEGAEMKNAKLQKGTCTTLPCRGGSRIF